jgi:hypothetical protein
MAGLRCRAAQPFPATPPVNPAASRGILAPPFFHSPLPWRNPPQFFAFGLGYLGCSTRSGGIPFVAPNPNISNVRVGSSFIGCLTFRSTRTLSLRASVLKQFSSSVLAAIGPVSFTR